MSTLDVFVSGVTFEKKRSPENKPVITHYLITYPHFSQQYPPSYSPASKKVPQVGTLDHNALVVE